jgi:hypothetical protein
MKPLVKSCAALVASALLSLASHGAASAATVFSGTWNVGSDGFVSFGLPIDLRYGGDWRISYEFTRPPTEGYADIQIERHYRIYYADTQNELEGNEFTIGPLIPLAPGSAGEIQFSFAKPSRIRWGPNLILYTTEEFQGAAFYLEFGSGGPVDYKFKVYHVGSIPEPSTWALLIIGVGMSGAMLRRRQRLQGNLAEAPQ